MLTSIELDLLMANKSSGEIIENLRDILPHIAIQTVWELDKTDHSCFNKLNAHLMTVVAMKVDRGVLVTGKSLPKGYFAPVNGPYPDIQHSFLQMVKEAFYNLHLQLIEKNANDA